MGGAIARGLAQGTMVGAQDIWVSNPSLPKLEALKADYPAINITHDIQVAVASADMVILAVKPWLMQEVMSKLTIREEQLVGSVAAGISFEDLRKWSPAKALFRVIPNTAISRLASMTLIASSGADEVQETLLVRLFDEMGMSMLIPESQIAATTSLTSCGIAYALKYIQAAMQAGVEMGVRPKDAMRMVAQSLEGAARLILDNDTHPSVEIDKVTTPGGLTIRGINELDHAGFTSAIIRAMKASK